MSYRALLGTVRSLKWLATSLVILLVLLSTLPVSATGSPADTVTDAWQQARQSDTYAFDSNVIITSYPLPSLANTGRSPTVDRIATAGEIDQSAEKMTFTLWNGTQGRPEDGMQVCVEDGESWQRVGDGGWEPAENVGDIFAPGGDPFLFLEGAENVAFIGTDSRAVGDLTIEYDRYTFDLDGPHYANLMRQKLEVQLLEKGALPPGVNLQAPTRYMSMVGTGELWLDQAGLPARMALHLDFPRHEEDGRFISEIITDFRDYETTASVMFWEKPLEWYTVQQPVIAEAATDGLSRLLVAFGILYGLWYMVIHSRSRRVYTVVVIVWIVAMVFTPLLQVRSLEAFHAQVGGDSAGDSAETEPNNQATINEARSEQAEAWNPNQPPATQLVAAQSQATARGLDAVATVADTTDNDGDGVLLVDENYWESCDGDGSVYCVGVADSADSDGDGLSDYVELFELGLDPASDDTDGDGILDNSEVDGFSYGGSSWYLNPREMDTNSDGIPDAVDCQKRAEGSDGYNPIGYCGDTDGDGTPDAWDADNDGDQVPDRVDLEPFAASASTFNRNNPLGLQVNNLETDKPVFVDIQFRPTDATNLTLKDHVLDWPSGDLQGQFQRTLDTTFATTSNANLVDNASNAGNGDIRLVPMLQVYMPNESGHYANLPITNTAPTTRVDGAAVEDWIDQSQLDAFAIEIQDEPDGLLATVPLVPVIDEHAGTVAYQARMFYRPMQGTNDIVDWGNDHEISVVWFVQMLTDECIDPDDDPATCDRQDVLDVIHVYDETWSLSGMTISENHGMNLAVMYEDPDNDPQADYEEQLTQVAWNLSGTFLRARDCETLNNNVCTGDGNRDVTIANLDTTLASNDWLGADSYVTVSNNHQYDHMGYLGKFPSEVVLPILQSEWGNVATDTVPLILYAREISVRSVGLTDLAAPTAGGTATFDASVNPVTLTGSMSWTPYRHDGSSWVAYDQQGYLNALEQRLPQANGFFSAENNTPQARREAQGLIIMAQYFYAALLNGYASLLAQDDNSIFAVNPEISELTYEPFFASGSSTGFSTILVGIVETYIRGLSTSSKLRTIYEVFTQTKQLSHLPAGFQLLKTAYAKVAMALLAAIIVIAVAAVALYIIAKLTGDGQLLRVAEIILAVITIIMVIIQFIILIVNIIVATVVTVTSVLGLMAQMYAIGAMGVIIGAIISFGYLAYYAISNPGASNFEIELVASIAVAVTLFFLFLYILSFAGLGPLVLLLYVIDAIFLILNKKGPSTYAIEWLASQLYDIDMLLTNLDSEDRLETVLDHFALADQGAGFIASNQVGISFNITNTARYRQEFDLGQARRRAAFKYYLHTEPPEQPYHRGLSKGDSYDDWTPLGERVEGYNGAYYTSQKMQMVTNTGIVSLTLGTVGTGVNQPLPYTLTEAMLVSWIGCWGKLTNNTCNWDSSRQSVALDLSEGLTFDILPNTVTEFAKLNWNSNGELAFPPQRDLDGDGLSGLDGTDPNDYSADSDGDTLSDFYELNNGLDPLDADMDDDGLTDAEELRLKTNPRDADSDGDHLNDYLEVVQGWTISYDGSRNMRIYSNPYSADADGDTLTDLEEMALGFNPWVANDPSLARQAVQFDYLEVSEVGAPRTLLQFDDTTGNLFLLDSSGDGNHVTCDNCPVAGVAGRDSFGVQFDGIDDAITLTAADDIDLGLDTWSIGMWVKINDASTIQTLFARHDGANGIEAGEEEAIVTPSGVIEYLGQGVGFNSDPTNVNDGDWHHVMIAYGGTSGTFAIYVDGVDVTGGGVANPSAETTTDSLTIGHGPRFGFDGTMDNVVLYDVVFDSAEIPLLLNGAYDRDDLVVVSDAELTYQALITNTIAVNGIDGLLSAEPTTIDPALALPLVSFNFDTEQYQRQFTNETGGTNALTCLGDTACPQYTNAGAVDDAVLFDGVDDTILFPSLNISPTGTFVTWWMNVETLPTSGERAYIFDTASTTDGAVDLYIDSDGYLWADVAGTTGDARTTDCGSGASSWESNCTTDNSWADQHKSDFTFNGNLNTWVHVGFWLHNETTQFAVNSNRDSYVTRTSTPTNVQFGSGNIGRSYDGGLDDLVVYYNTTFSDEWDTPEKDEVLEDIQQQNYIPEFGYEIRSNGFFANESRLHPALHAKFETAEHVVIEDSARKVRGASCVGNCPTLTTDGVFGSALAFDGSNDTLTLDSIDFAQDDYTISLWFKRESTASRRLLSAYDLESEDARITLQIDGSGLLNYIHTFNGSASAQIVSPSSIATNQWYHVAAVRAGDDMRLYLDGVLIGTHTPDGVATGELGVLLGVRNPDDNQEFKGKIDEVAIIPSAASAEGVQLLMSSQLPLIDVRDEFVEFSVEPSASILVSGSLSVNTTDQTSTHNVQIEAEAAIDVDVASLYPSSSVSSRLVNFLPFEEAPNASTFFDFGSGASAPSCYLGNCPASGLRGKVGRAAHFDGQDDAILFANDSFGDQFTIATWIKADGGTIVDRTNERWIDNRLQREGFQLDFDGLWLFAGVREEFIPLSLPKNEWVHVALVSYGLNASNNEYLFYVNGERVSRTFIFRPTGFTYGGTNEPLIGRNRNGLDPLNGMLDDLRIYDRRYSDAWIADLYEDSAPKLHFEFEEPEGATAFVDSAQGYIGNPVVNSRFDATLGETITTTSPTPGSRGFLGNGTFYDQTGLIEVVDSAELFNVTNDMTIMAWVRPQRNSVSQNIVTSSLLQSYDGYSFSIDDTGVLQFNVWSANKNYKSTATVRWDVWQHVAVVFDSSNQIHFYINGVLSNSVNGVAGVGEQIDDITIGGIVSNAGGILFSNGLRGDLDELSIYHRSLSAEELASTYLREFRFFRAIDRSIVTVDVLSPTVELLTDADYFKHGYIQLGVAATDPDSSVQRVDFQIEQNSAVVQDWTRADVCVESAERNSAWCPAFDSTNLNGEGVYTIQFRAFDAVGHVTLSDSYTLNIDGTAPQATANVTGGDWTALTDAGEAAAWIVPLSGTVSDPEIAAGVAGSGVHTPTVKVQLFNTAGELIGNGSEQSAIVNGNNWSIAYVVKGIAPHGDHTIQLSVRDVLGNENSSPIASSGVMQLDERPPSAEIAHWELPNVISDTTTLNGVTVESAIWGGNVARYHMESLTNNVLRDHGESSFDGSCTNCPMITAGLFGNAAQFDGINDTITLPTLFNPISNTFSIALWFNPDASSGSQALIQQGDLNGTGRTLLYLNGSKRLVSNLGGSSTVGSVSASTGQWHHAVVTYDGTTLQMYLDGVLDKSAEITPEATDGILYIGSNRNGAAFFDGFIDEVSFYGRALTIQEVAALAQPENVGTKGVDVWLNAETFDEDDEPTAVWQAATVNNQNANASDWSYMLPSDLEGFYNIVIRSSDQFDNTSNERTVWRGMVDMVPPQFTASAEMHGAGDTAYTEYTLSASDFWLALDASTLPCDESALGLARYGGNAYVPNFNEPYSLSTTCRVSGHHATTDIVVCDEIGHCTAQTVVATDATSPTAVAIVTPTNSLTIIGNDVSMPLQIAAVSDNALENMGVWINGELFASQTPAEATNGVFDFGDWQPTTSGSYTILASMNGIEDTITVNVGIYDCLIENDGDQKTDLYSNDMQALQDAVDSAEGGATLRISGTCNGTTDARQTEGKQLLHIEKPITLNGGYDKGDWSHQSGTATATLDALNQGHVIVIASGTAVTLTNLIVKDGSTSGFTKLGSGIRNEGTLLIDNVHIFSNQGASGAGGLYNTGDAIIQNSLISENSGAGSGAGLMNAESGTMQVINSVFQDNWTHWSGAAIMNQVGGIMTVTHSTIVSNTTDFEGGGTGLGAVYNATENGLLMSNSVVVGNNVGGDLNHTHANCRVVVDGGYNVVAGSICKNDSGTTLHVDPTTEVLPFSGNSPVIDFIPAGTAGCQTTFTTDMRGLPRNDLACDSGAYELQFSDSATVSRAVSSGESVTFGPTLAKATVTDDGGCLTDLTVQLIDAPHPNDTDALQDRYWSITPVGCSTGFSVNLTLPSLTQDANEELCRYDTGLDFWMCDITSRQDEQITLDGVGQFSDWAVANAVPTAVTLVSFMAQQSGEDVLLEWETATETNHAGFNVYRRLKGGRNAWALINSQLIASRGTQAQGAHYQLVDSAVQHGNWEYLLEDVELDGRHTRHEDRIAEITTLVPTAAQFAHQDVASLASNWLVIAYALLNITGFALWYDRRRQRR